MISFCPIAPAFARLRFSPFYLALLSMVAQAFKRQESRDKVGDFTLGMLCCEGRKTIANGILFKGRDQQNWNPDYRLMSDAVCREEELWDPVIDLTLDLADAKRPIYSAQDDTRLPRTGKKIPGVAYGRDPQSPPFQVNLTLGHRFLATSLLARGKGDPRPWRSIPVGFQHAPPAKAPKGLKRPEKQKYLKEARKKQNISRYAIEEIYRLRKRLDQHPSAKHKLLYNTADGSFANEVYLNDIPHKTVHIVRFRKDAALRAYLPPEKRDRLRKYGPKLPTPEQMRRDPSIPWQSADFFISGQKRRIDFKVIDKVCWQKVTKDRPLRLILIAPVGYRLRKGSALLYRDPAYLLVTATDPHIDVSRLDPYLLIEAYLCRWEIEVNFRDAKTDVGLGQAQVWNDCSIERTPAFLMLCYSCLLLASLLAFNDERPEEDFGKLPKWRRDHPLRPSCRDLLRLLKQEVAESGLFPHSALPNSVLNRIATQKTAG